MAITIGNLMDHCRSAYNAVGDTFFPDSWFISMIWRAETELAIQGWVIEDTFTTTSLDGTRELAYPSNTLAIKELRYDNKMLKKVTLAEDPKTNSVEPQGQPYQYAVWDNTIILMPTPNENGKTIQVRAFVSPAQLSASTDPLNVPDEYQIQISDFLLAQMSYKDQNLSLGNTYAQKWEQTVERARQQRRRRQRGDGQMRVRDTYFGSDLAWPANGVYDG